MLNQDIQLFYTYLQSRQNAQTYLYHCYQTQDDEQAKSNSYKNCDPFIYYIKHGLLFYEQGERVPTALQPILFFYGMTHLLKAAILTKRPNYPETTKVLAHGVSSRKRKKKNYVFMDDEVRIYHQGLFAYVAEHLFTLKTNLRPKISMYHLLALIPEMQPLFALHKQKPLVQVGQINDQQLIFPSFLLDRYHVTASSFIHRVTPYLPEIVTTTTQPHAIKIEITQPLHHSNLLFTFDFQNQTISFPAERDLFMPLPEIMSHYLLLYNLSMLSRYETAWWGDLFQHMDSTDYPFITRYLQITAYKGTQLIGNMLYDGHRM